MARITIKDVAKASGFSVCTVNKALTGKHWVSEDTRKRIIDIAQQMGYTPNRLAQSLARRALTIAVVYPTFWGHWFEPLVAGARQRLDALHDHNVTAKYYPIHGTPFQHNLDEVLTQIAHDALDGVVICMGAFDVEFVQDQQHRLSDLAIPVVLLGGAHPGIPHLAHVRADARRSGEMAAELLYIMTGGQPIAILHGKHAILDHEEKVDGVRAVADREQFPLVGAFETLSDPEIAYHMTRRLFEENTTTIGGIYIAVDNAAPGVCRFLQEAGLAGKVHVVATGVFSEIRDWMASGFIQMTLYQNMVEQGRMAVSTLYRYLTDQVTPPMEVLIPPQIAVRSNIDLLVNEQDVQPVGY